MIVLGHLAGMTVSWCCPHCEHPGSLELFRNYSTMRISVICGGCDEFFVIAPVRREVPAPAEAIAHG